MRIALAAFLLLHGIAHLVGFLTPWGLTQPAAPGGSPPRAVGSAIFGGRIALGETMARGLGLLWLLAALAFAIVAVAVWRQAAWWREALLVVTLGSLALSVVWWPDSRIGVAINLVLLALLASLAADWLQFARS